ncbi:MAG: glycogen synthase [Bryobacterales bacterium]|nr:glycogen synthase [Bryobacterales bacterium]
MARILMVASEAAPFAKSGGLADVVGALPHALSALGHEVGVVVPRYASISLDEAQRVWQNQVIAVGPHRFSADIFAVNDRGVTVYFADIPPLFDRPGTLYGQADDHLRFGAFCHAALAVARFLFTPDVLHLHDWQASLCASYLRTRYDMDPVLRDLKVVFTIHNLEYNGRFGRNIWPELGLPDWLFQPNLLEYFGDVALMKGAIVFADAITTVSPRYAAEIQTPEFGFGLDGLLRANAHKLTGILNGVDYSQWSPETDQYIAAHYAANDLEGKRICKQDLLAQFDLPAENMDRPLLGIVTRFATQKGIDIIEQVAWPLLYNDDVAFAVLGSAVPKTPDVRFEHFFEHLRSVFPDRVGIYIGFNNALAHKIEAGSDMFLMPSRFEPCGLNQMYSLRYGTVPLVRATGGLDDTVDSETGFKFWGYWPPDFLSCIRVALDEFRKRPADWKHRMAAGMKRDYSWDASARHYSDLYRSLIA